jgi:hypothetical protein
VLYASQKFDPDMFSPCTDFPFDLPPQFELLCNNNLTTYTAMDNYVQSLQSLNFDQFATNLGVEYPKCNYTRLGGTSDDSCAEYNTTILLHNVTYVSDLVTELHDSVDLCSVPLISACYSQATHTHLVVSGLGAIVIVWMVLGISVSGYPSIESLIAQTHRLKELDEGVKVKRAEILEECRRYKLTQPPPISRGARVALLLFILAAFDGLLIVSLFARASPESIQNWNRYMWLIVILQAIVFALAEYVFMHILFKIVPSSFETVKHQLAIMTRQLKCSLPRQPSSEIDSDATLVDTKNLRLWHQARDFMMQYDHLYLYNSSGLSVGVSVLLVVLSLVLVPYGLFVLRSDASEGISMFKAGSWLMITGIFFLVAIVCALSSLLYLSQFMSIISWSAKQVDMIKRSSVAFTQHKNAIILSLVSSTTDGEVEDDPRIQKLEAAIVFLDTLAEHVEASTIPPTIFGFAFSPAMLTALEGYIATGFSAFVAQTALLA